jgi:hypothetical protein
MGEGEESRHAQGLEQAASSGEAQGGGRDPPPIQGNEKPSNERPGDWKRPPRGGCTPLCPCRATVCGGTRVGHFGDEMPSSHLFWLFRLQMIIHLGERCNLTLAQRV